MVKMFQLASVLVGFLMAGYCYGYLIDVTECKQNYWVPVGEDGDKTLICTGTEDNMQWRMLFYINSTYSYWQTIANCTPTACTNFEQLRYLAKRTSSSSSNLQIMHADRMNIGTHIQCSSLSGDQSDSCKLVLYYESVPRDCKMEIDRVRKMVTGSCIIDKFYRSDGYEKCYLFEGYFFAYVPARLEHSTIVDPVNLREYQNGTCSFTASLSRGYDTYFYRVSVLNWNIQRFPQGHTLTFAPDPTTTQTSKQTRVTAPDTTSKQTTTRTPDPTSKQTTTQIPDQTPVQPSEAPTTVIPSGPEKTSTQPATDGGTDPSNNTYRYALLGVCIALVIVSIILIIISVFLCKARNGGALPRNFNAAPQQPVQRVPQQVRDGNHHRDIQLAPIQDEQNGARSSSTDHSMDDDGYLIPVNELSNNDGAPSSNTARPFYDGCINLVSGPCGYARFQNPVNGPFNDGSDSVPCSSTARPDDDGTINLAPGPCGNATYLHPVNGPSNDRTVSPSGYSKPYNMI